MSTMSTDMAGTAMDEGETSALIVARLAAKSSRRIPNDTKWNSIKNEVYSMYIAEGSTLQKTMKVIGERSGFKARYEIASDLSLNY
jgi:hypothetical protein